MQSAYVSAPGEIQSGRMDPLLALAFVVRDTQLRGGKTKMRRESVRDEYVDETQAGGSPPVGVFRGAGE